MNKKYEERSGTYNLIPTKRARLPRDYGELYSMLHVQEQLWQVYHTLLTQYALNKGLIFYKEEGAKVVLKELRQLHRKVAIEPNEPIKMTREENQSALRYLMLLTKKPFGIIKGRRCADCRK